MARQQGIGQGRSNQQGRTSGLNLAYTVHGRCQPFLLPRSAKPELSLSMEALGGSQQQAVPSAWAPT